MSRPCHHAADVLPERGQPYREGQCRVCWLYVHDARYRAIWTDPARVQQPRRVQPPKKKGCGCNGRG